MHSHLIPGIDDGAKTLADSIRMVRQLIKLGFEKIITTPHVMGDYYPNTSEQIEAGLQELKIALKKENISIEIEAAAEYFIDDFFENLLNKKKQLRTFSGNKLLIEFSTFAPPGNIFEIIFQLKTKGYQPILAHPERYVYYETEFNQFDKIKNAGCSFQVNLLSLVGHYGRKQKKIAIKLLRSGLVDYLATDLHSSKQISQIEMIYKDREVRKLVNQIEFKNASL